MEDDRSFPVYADFVVVGSGAAGLTAALAAREAGAEVVVLEKSALVGGTSAISGGAVWIANNRHMVEVGVADSRDDGISYLSGCSRGAGDPHLIAALVDRGDEVIGFLESWAGMKFRAFPAEGGRLDYRHATPGAKWGGRSLDPAPFEKALLGDAIARLRRGPKADWRNDPIRYFVERLHLRAPDQADPGEENGSSWPPGSRLGGGAALMAGLLRACVLRGVRIITEAPVETLLRSGRQICGVRATKGGVPFDLNSRVGVLLATGGFSHNRQLSRLWLDRPLEVSCEISENQGDGHLLGLLAGASLANVGDAWWVPQIISRAVDDDLHTNVTGTREERSLPHTLMVNRDGRRFMNEAINYYDAGAAFWSLEHGDIGPVYLIFDQAGVERYQILHSLAAAGARTCGYAVADDLSALAKMIGVSPTSLGKTVSRFNTFALRGEDPDFGRGESVWDSAWGDPGILPNPALAPLVRPPFHAVRLRLGALATKGGLRINANAQVVDPQQEPIPGLFAAGNVSNGAVPNAYPGAGATLGAAMTFGYIAARHAMKAQSPH